MELCIQCVIDLNNKIQKRASVKLHEYVGPGLLRIATRRYMVSASAD
jgi:hypothetical protein